jgi:hypothetical protein
MNIINKTIFVFVIGTNTKLVLPEKFSNILSKCFIENGINKTVSDMIYII